MKTVTVRTNINRIEGGEYDMTIKPIMLEIPVPDNTTSIITKEQAEDIATTYAEEAQLEYYEKYLRYDYLTRQDPAEKEAMIEIYEEAYKEAYTILEKQYTII